MNKAPPPAEKPTADLGPGRLLVREDFRDRGYAVELRRFGDPSRPRLNKKLDPSTIEVTIWNVEKAGNEGWQPDFERMVTSSDIVLTQEALLRSEMVEVMQAEHGHVWHMAESFAYGSNKIPTGVATGGRAEPATVSYLRSPDTEPFTNTPKLIMKSTYGLEGRDDNLLVLNIHGINFVSNKAYRRQLAQLDRALEAHDGPVLLAGDFNTWNRTRTKDLEKLAEKHGLGHVDWDHGEPKKFMGSVLDRALVRGVTVDASHVDNAVTTSDHPPLHLTLRVLEKPSS